MEKILTVNDVASILQVKAITVREMFREKRLRGFKVGKSWRTTESMLQEDIDALARGESPAELPMPSAGTLQEPTVPKAVTAPAPAPSALQKPEPPARPAQPAPAVRKPEPAPSPEQSAPATSRPAPKPPAPPEKDEGDDDTQQMLF